MKRLISYIWPIRKYVDSDINGMFEITWINGKKILDGKNTNYSYGSLQRILNYGLSKVDINSVSEILLLGLGGGSVIQTLREKFYYKGKITAIEIDEAVIIIAEKEFNISNGNGLEVISSDAFSYIAHFQTQYSLIIIYLFIGKYVPPECYSFKFWEMLIPLINQEGYVIFNAGINLTEENKIDKIMVKFNYALNFTKYDNIEGTNTLLIAKKLLPIE